MHDKLKIASVGSAIFSKSGNRGYMWHLKLACASKGEADKARNELKQECGLECKGEVMKSVERRESYPIRMESETREGNQTEAMDGGRG